MPVIDSKIITPTIVVLSLLSLVSLGFGMGLMSQSDGSMDGCPFAMGQMSMCPMSLSSHVGHWLSSLLAIAKTQSSLISLILLAGILFAWFITSRLTKPPQVQLFRRFLFEHNPLGKTYNQFLNLFSSGILHTKVFSA